MTKTPATIGKYEIKGVIGEGATGIVYEGYDPFVQRSVAVKVAKHSLSKDDKDANYFTTTFFDEAHIAGQLTHPHVVSIYDAGIEAAGRYIVMEYVPGKTLKDYCQKEQLLPIQEVVDIAFKCSRALYYAHSKDVVHRDVKPANIILGQDGVPKVLDFGVARMLAQSKESDKVLVGTPTYFAPEQISEGRTSPQSDIYAMGAVMYELLSGVKPFQAKSVDELLKMIVNDDPRPLIEVNSDVPGILANIVERALHKEPVSRYQTAMELSTDLSRAYTALRKNTSTVVGERFNILKTLTFFKNFSDTELDEIAQMAQWCSYLPKTKIIKEGGEDRDFYILAEGEAFVAKGRKMVNALKAGDCFGEMSLASRDKRSATVIAKGNVILLRFTVDMLDKCSMATQLRLYKVLLETMTQRLSLSNQLVSRL